MSGFIQIAYTSVAARDGKARYLWGKGGRAPW